MKNCRNKDRQIEEEAEKNESELKFFKQKVKHLQFEQQNELTEAKAEAMVSLKMAQDDYTAQEKQLLKDKRDLKSLSRDAELAHEEQIKSMKLVRITYGNRDFFFMWTDDTGTRRRNQQKTERIRREGQRTGT